MRIANAGQKRVLLLCILLLAFALRIYRLDHSSLWIDEGFTTLRSGYPVPEILSNTITIQDGSWQDPHPALHYLILHFSRVFLGQSDFSYRYPSVLAGVLLVPLLFKLARRMAGERVAYLTLFFTAINPLQIYYAQEARMYATVVLLAAAASYFLWLAITGRRLWRWLFFYFLFAIAALFTNYTAIFLVGLQTVIAAWLLWREGHRRLLLVATGLGLTGLILLHFLPIRIPTPYLEPSRSYGLKAYLQILQDVVFGFSLGLTAHWADWAERLLGISAALLLLLGITCKYPSRNDIWQSRIFLLVYLFATVLGLTLLELINPQYMGLRHVRHIMVGSPAFLLLLARGVAYLPKRPFSLLPVAGLAIVLSGPIISLNGLFYNADFAKDDFRSLVQYLESHAGNNDFVIYHRAGYLSLHTHYATRLNLPYTALPPQSQKAGPETVTELRNLADQYERIWFVTGKPMDKRDNEGVVAQWLETNLVEIDRHAFHGITTQVGLVAYMTKPWHLSDLPPDCSPLDISLGDLPRLLGIRLGSGQPAKGPTLWFDLFWQERNVPAGDMQLRFGLRGQDGQLWVDSDQPFRWIDETQLTKSDYLIRLSYGLPVPVGTPPGPYELLIRAWARSTGQISDWSYLTTVDLAASDSWPWLPKLSLINEFPAHFGNGLILLGVSAPAQEVRPGHSLPMTLYWQRRATLVDPHYVLEVVGPDGTVIREISKSPGPEWLKAADWPLETTIAEPMGLYFPPEIQPGRYRLRWRVLSDDQTIPGRLGWRPWVSREIVLGDVRVLAWPMERDLPTTAVTVAGDFGSAIRLYGYEVSKEGEDLLEVTLYWQAQEVPDRSYFSFVHVVQAKTDMIISQLDRIPVDWLRPTNGWRRGEVLTDVYRLPLPISGAPDDFDIYVGIYDPENGQRLPVVVNDEAQVNDQLLLTTIEAR